MAIGNSLHQLREATYVAGQSIPLDLGTLKARAKDQRLNYIKGILIEVYVNLTSAGTSDAVTARQLYDLVRELLIVDNAGRRIIFDTPMNLAQVRMIETYLRNKAVESVTAVSANSNTTNERTFRIFVPLEQAMLVDRQACMQPAALLSNGKISFRWSGSGLGTGQTINATTRVRFYAEVVARDDMEHRAEVFYGTKGIAQFVGDRVPLRGQVALLALAIEGASATIASNDFTDYGLEGRNADVPRGTDIDIPTDLWNRHVPDAAAEKTNPTTGTITDFPLIALQAGDKLSDLIYEDELMAYLTVGAGAPATADQVWLYAVIRPKDVSGVANALGATAAIKGNAADWNAQLTAANAVGARGFGGVIPPSNPVAPFVVSKVITDAKKCC